MFFCVFVADDPFDKAPKTHLLRFKAPGREVSVKCGNSYLPMRRDAEGWYECVVSSCQGLLIEADLEALPEEVASDGLGEGFQWARKGFLFRKQGVRGDLF